MVQQARYQVRLQDTGGNTRAIFDDFRSLDYELRVNDFGTITFIIDGNDTRQSLFLTDSILQVWRQPDGHPWYKEAEFFHRTPNPQETETGLRTYTSYGRDFMDLLARREILYTGTTLFTNKAGAGESVMKDYVRENAAEEAISPPRKAPGATQGLTIEADRELGGPWRGQRSMRNLLEVLQEIALATGVDFRVVRTNTDDNPEFLFITGTPSLGADLTDTVIFDTHFGNMIGPNYTKSRTEEANVVAVLGPGTDVSRIVITQESLAVDDSPWNRIETSTDGSSQPTIEMLFTLGEQELARRAAQESLTFQVLQTENTQYGVNYRLGDRVTAQFAGILAIKKLTRVHITVDAGKEVIETEFADVVVGARDPLYQVVRNLNTRIRELAATNI